MNSLVETLNLWSGRSLHLAGTMFWQSSLLIGVILVIDFSCRRRFRPAIRYGLWLLVLIKLVLPPSLSLPTGLGWWLRPAPPAHPTMTSVVTVTYGPASVANLTSEEIPVFSPP